ncbi:hypothetical protein [Chondrinema litorale]|uniref:hypothetical protein n=1 Tax=Chondrinema litorale TaxID=2994555 RepID=UPI002542B750|nr:hypothetical protein [Chondrinema litorale]UZS00280.1 hypothetical protein OQ292_40780 [Chondrinema litorale]
MIQATSTTQKVFSDEHWRKTVQLYKDFLFSTQKLASYSDFVPMDEYKPIFEKMFAYFKEKEPKKGLLLFGLTGNFKTSAILFFQMLCNEFKQYEHNRFKYVSCSDIIWTLMYQNNLASVRKYMEGSIKDNDSYCFEELGREPLYSNFGNQINIMASIIDYRDKKGLLTHYVTNSNLPELEKKYGSHVLGRIVDKTVRIEFPEVNHRLRDIKR